MRSTVHVTARVAAREGVDEVLELADVALEARAQREAAAMSSVKNAGVGRLGAVDRRRPADDERPQRRERLARGRAAAACR